MGFRFRKTFGKGPFKMTVSKSGVGYSVGGKGFRVTKKAGGGTRTTANIPGTGISYSTDSKKKKTTKTTSVAKKSSQSNASTKRSGGCLTSCLWFLGFCLVIGLISKYWKVLLSVALIGAAAYIAFKVYRKKHPTELPEVSAENHAPDGAPNELPTISVEHHNSEIAPAEVELTSQQIFELRCAENAKLFEEELQTIPKIEVTLSDPAPRQLLKNLPEYSFSNITRKTRLDSIFPLVFLDVETTGFAPSKCEILEVSAIKFDSGMTPVAAFSTLCKPNKPIPEEASAVNHITDDMVADAPAFAQIAPALTDFLKGCHVAGHNLDFDLRFIHAHGVQLPEKVRFYDTLDIAHLTIPQSSIYNYKLDSVCHYYGIWRDNAHRSLSDAYATAKIFTNLVQDKTSRQLDATAEILSEITAE